MYSKSRQKGWGSSPDICTGTRSYFETEGYYQPIIIFRIEGMIDGRTITETNPFLSEIARTTHVGKNNNRYSQGKT